MRVLSATILLLMLSGKGMSQAMQPVYIGHASWVRSATNLPPEKLAVTPHTYTTKPKPFPDKPGILFQRRIHLQVKTTQALAPVKCTLAFQGKKFMPSTTEEAPPLIAKDNQELNITYTNKQHGYVSNSSAFAEDEEGNIWIASLKGLIKYDGYHYSLYDERSGLPNEEITSLAFDGYKRLWIGTAKGLRFMRNDSLFTPQCQALNLSNVNCINIETDRYHRVWISTQKDGAVCIDDKALSIYDFKCGLPTNYIMTAHVDKENNILLGLWGQGLAILKQDKLTLLSLPAEPRLKTEKNIILSVYDNEEGTWIGGFQSGLINMNGKDTIQYGLNSEFTNRIYDIKKAPGGLWLSLYGGGVCYFNKNNPFVIRASNGLQSDYTFRLFEDSFHNLWISDLDAGFSRLNENCFYKVQDKSGALNYATNIVPSLNGKWFFTAGLGAFFQEKISQRYYYMEANNSDIKFMYPQDGALANDGSIWMGSYGEGPVMVKDGVLTSYRYPGLAESRVINSVKKDRDNKIWFSTMQYGVVVLDNNAFLHYSKNSGLLQDEPLKLYLDENKKLYCAFSNGLQRITKAGIENLAIDNTRLNEQVNCFFSKDSSTSFIATEFSGLLVFYEGKVYRINTSNGLLSNKVNSVTQAADGKIWITTAKGIEYFVMKGITVLEHKAFDQFNGVYMIDLTNVLPDQNGQLFWALAGRKLVYDPLFRRDENKPPVFSINKMNVNDKDADIHSTASVLPDGRINIDYSVRYWGRENNLLIRCMLISDNGDTITRSVDRKGQVSIRDIPPGNYHAFITADDNGKMFMSAPFLINVGNFWYNTLLFRLIMVGLILLYIIIYFRRKSAAQKKINELLTIQVAEQTKELVREKNELLKSNLVIDEQNKEKDVLIEEINHRVKNNLQFIAAMLEMQMNKKHSLKVLQALLGTSRRIKAMSLVHELLYDKRDSSGLSMRSYINELINNLKEMADMDTLPVEINLGIDDLVMDSKRALAIGMIISELVSNSFKYAFTGISKPVIIIRLRKDP